MVFETDNTIRGFPKCPCGRRGFVLVSGNFLCGECVLKLEKKKQKMMFEALKENDENL